VKLNSRRGHARKPFSGAPVVGDYSAPGPITGGEGAGCPSPRTPPALGLSGLAADPISFSQFKPWKKDGWIGALLNAPPPIP